MSSTKIFIASQACSINQHKNLRSHIHLHRFTVPIFVTNWIKQLNCIKYLPFQNGNYLGIYKLWSTPMWIRHPPKLIKHGTETKYYLHVPSEFQCIRPKSQKSWLYTMCNNLWLHNIYIYIYIYIHTHTFQ